MDQKLVAQFDKIGGFRCIADTFVNFGGESEAILTELLSLFFWRVSSRGVLSQASCNSPTESPPLNEAKVDNDMNLGSSDSKPSREAGNNSNSFFSMFSWMSKPEKMESSLVCDGPPRSLAEGTDPSSEDVRNSEDYSVSNMAIEEEKLDTFQSILQGVEKNDSPLNCEKCSGTNNNPPNIEMIVIPQLFEAILKVLEKENYPERVISVISSIEDALTYPRPAKTSIPTSSWRDMINTSEAVIGTITHNMDTLTGEKSSDWLLWIYNCLTTFKRRDSQDMLQDGIFLSMSDEGESGFESGDESVDTERRNQQQNSCSGRTRLNASSPVVVQHHYSQFVRFADPLFNLVQAVLRLDIVRKPSTSRKLYDILKLPAPEAAKLQLSFLFDLLQSVNNHQHYSHDYNTYMNVLRNISAFLEKVLMKCDVSFAFCVEAVHTLDSLVYRAPADVRNKVKDTLLPEVRNTYVTYCLIQRSESVWPRIRALAEMHSSVLNLIIASESRSIYDHQIFLLLLELFLQSSSLNIEDDEVSLDISNCRSEENQMNFEMQIAVVALIQNCVLASVDCRRCAEKVFNKLIDHSPSLSLTTSVIMRAFQNNFGDTNRQRCVSPEFSDCKFNEKTSTSARTSWWGSFVGTSNSETHTTQQVDAAGSEKTVTSERNYDEDSLIVTQRTHSDHDTDVEFHAEGDSACSNNLPSDTASFCIWFNSAPQRQCVEVLNAMLPKLMEPVHRHGDKLLEKIIQKQSQGNIKAQNKRQKELALLERVLKELLQKASMSDSKRREKYNSEVDQFAGKIKKRILMGSMDFKSYVEVSSRFVYFLIFCCSIFC